ncbi:MAG: hypothetical protein LBS94_00570 [Prevotellaceae bacterium]|jgi:hypothetical protein|nr:hypothetical protein [Prevotellaceae bacterium]
MKTHLIKPILCAVLLAFCACQKEDSTDTFPDFARGKKDGNALCDCLAGLTDASSEAQALCLMRLDINELMTFAANAANQQMQVTDYLAGVITAPCAMEALMNFANSVDVEDYPTPEVDPPQY